MGLRSHGWGTDTKLSIGNYIQGLNTVYYCIYRLRAEPPPTPLEPLLVCASYLVIQ